MMYLLIAQPELALEVAEASFVVVPVSREVLLAVLTSLNHRPSCTGKPRGLEKVQNEIYIVSIKYVRSVFNVLDDQCEVVYFIK